MFSKVFICEFITIPASFPCIVPEELLVKFSIVPLLNSMALFASIVPLLLKVFIVELSNFIPILVPLIKPLLSLLKLSIVPF
ncbi:hypothetical protein H2256_00675 [Campylobacter sp. RM9929]|uniref:hypothetical protein n=1 Tax=Campylobacter molothri TaxID=1032242 RepID=UPI001DE18DD6|nr:hypothetical protein [Campylobacter sp. RM9929]